MRDEEVQVVLVCCSVVVASRLVVGAVHMINSCAAYVTLYEVSYVGALVH